jgi:hypothetical protein
VLSAKCPAPFLEGSDDFYSGPPGERSKSYETDRGKPVNGAVQRICFCFLCGGHATIRRFVFEAASCFPEDHQKKVVAPPPTFSDSGGSGRFDPQRPRLP